MFSYIMWSVFIYLAVILICGVFEDEVLYGKHWRDYYYEKLGTSYHNKVTLKVIIFSCIPIIRWIFLLIAVGMIFVDYYDVKDWLDN